MTHDDAVRIEAERIVAILGRLTDEQRAQVKELLYDHMCMTCWRHLPDPKHRCYCDPRYDI